MSEEEKISSSSKLAKWIGGLTMALGGALVLMAFFPVKEFLTGGKQWMDCMIMLIIVALMVIPGVLVMLGGYQFLREVNLPNLKVLVGVYSAVGVIWISARVSDWHPEVWDQRIAFASLNLGMAISGILIYLIALRVLMPAFGMKWNGCRSVLAKGAFVLLAWLLWMALSAISRGMARDGFIERHFGLVVLFGPIFLAWFFYIIAVNWLRAGQQDSKNPE